MTLRTIPWAIDFITAAHHGQFDKAGVDYWRHPVGVMELLPVEAPHSWKLAALLHDVVEDTNWTLKQLAHWFPDDVIDIVELVTHRKHLCTYFQYVQSIIDSENHGALMVKWADLTHNSNPERVGHALLPRTLVQRWLKAKAMIAPHINGAAA